MQALGKMVSETKEQFQKTDTGLTSSLTQK